MSGQVSFRRTRPRISVAREPTAAASVGVQYPSRCPQDDDHNDANAQDSPEDSSRMAQVTPDRRAPSWD